MTNQEAFDIAVSGVIAQGQPGWDVQRARCAYRGQDGTKCAIGMLIPDDVYESWSGSDRRAGVDARAYGPKKWVRSQGLSVELMADLQGAHDDAAAIRIAGAFVGRFKRYARQVADAHGLEWRHG